MSAASAAVNYEVPFAGSTGRGIKVAVIDSGVHIQHPHICAVTHTVSWELDVDCEDRVGHGTAVMAAIQERAPDAEYFALKLFDTSLRTTTHRLVNALNWAIDHGMDIVNLSLGTDNPASSALLQPVIERAHAAGVIVVAARSAGMFPGSLPGVIGVSHDWSLPREQYQVSADGFIASGYPRSLPGRTPARNLHGVSFAVANMTGFVARACEGMRDRSLDAVRRALQAEVGLKTL
jgi:subtilisin family serine protease